MEASVKQRSRMSFYMNRCRVCLDKVDKLYPLVGQVANVETTISHMITYCTSLEVEMSDDLPKGVCVPCFRIIRMSYNFINQYKETLKILTENRMKVEENPNLEIETGVDNHTDENYLEENLEEIKHTRTNDKSKNISRMDEELKSVHSFKLISDNNQYEETNQTDIEQEEVDQTDIEQEEVEQTDIEQEEVDQIDIEQEEVNQSDIEQEEIDQTDVDQDEIEVFEHYEDEQVVIGGNIEEHDYAEENNCSTVDVEFEQLENAHPVNDNLSSQYNFHDACSNNSKQNESLEHIVIVAENENNQAEHLGTINISEQKPKYTLRTKIVSKLKCPKCIGEFTGYDKKYKDHMIKLHSKEMFNCNSCSQKNLTVKEYLSHFEEIHRYQCPICRKSFPKNSMRAVHMKIHTNIICKQSNLQPLVLKNEEKNLNDVDVKQEQNCEEEEEECSEPQINDNYRRRLVTRYKCPKCPHVGPYLNYEKGFMNHILFQHIHELFDCNLCSTKNLDVDEFLKHFGKIHRFQCSVCKKSFNRISTKQVHMKTHSDIRYPCSYCDKSFYTPWFLKKHMNKHTETVKYTCDDCGYSSATYDNFRYHMKKHQGPKHLCTFCGQSFLLAVHLKYHMWKHTGDKYFKCDQCTKSYTSGSQLKKHKRRHH